MTAATNMSPVLGVYLPISDEAFRVDRGTAIVGSPLDDWHARSGVSPREPVAPGPARLMVDIESNRHRAVNLATFADRCLHAAERHLDYAPTSKRRAATEAELVLVATFDRDRLQVSPLDAEGWSMLADWLGISPGDSDALLSELQPHDRRAASRPPAKS